MEKQSKVKVIGSAASEQRQGHSRRNLLKQAAIVSGIVALGGAAGAVNCGLVTPPQTEGPFYPIAEQIDSDGDLTYVKDRIVKATGQEIYIQGIVQDKACKPISGALVEIWQACATGRYNHPSDTNPAQLDPNFQYFGRAISNEKGSYEFKTIRPGHYPATNSWVRPAHIHYKVHLRGYEELTTQLYFKGDPYNKNDRILQSLNQSERDEVIVDFQLENDKLVGKFDLRLNLIE